MPEPTQASAQLRPPPGLEADGGGGIFGTPRNHWRGGHTQLAVSACRLGDLLSLPSLSLDG